MNPQCSTRNLLSHAFQPRITGCVITHHNTFPGTMDKKLFWTRLPNRFLCVFWLLLYRICILYYAWIHCLTAKVFVFLSSGSFYLIFDCKNRQYVGLNGGLKQTDALLSFRATTNNKVKETVALELSFVNSNLQLLKEELEELNSSMEVYQTDK